MYRYNSRFLQILADFIHPMTSIVEDGYSPIEESFDPMQTRLAERNNLNYSGKIDSLKAYFIESLIIERGKTGIIFVLSPVWYNQPIGNIQWITKVCKRYNIPLLDFSNKEKYVHNDLFFRDGVHLNSKGADEFTRDLVKAIKPLINEYEY